MEPESGNRSKSTYKSIAYVFRRHHLVKGTSYSGVGKPGFISMPPAYESADHYICNIYPLSIDNEADPLKSMRHFIEQSLFV